MRFDFELEQFLANKPKAVKEQASEIEDMVKRSFGMMIEDEEKTLTDHMHIPRVDAGKKMLQHYSVRIMIAVFALSLFFFRAELGTGIAYLLPDKNKKSGSDVFVESVRRQIASKPKYVPDQRDKYQESYTENVLHYTDYLESFAQENFEDKRLRSLRDYFFEELKLSENVIPPFIAEEKILIRDLMDLKSKINPKYEKEGIARMKTRELKSRSKLVDLLGGINNYNKCRERDKKFFENQ